MRRAIGSLMIGALVPGLAWLGGMEFVRGPDLALVTGFGLAIALISYTYPAWDW